MNGPIEEAMLRALVLASVLLAACAVVETERPRPAAQPVAHAAAPARAWNLVDDGEVLGYVVLFEAASAPESPVFVVQNRWHQDLGMIDALGRAWRFRPHEEEAEWVTTGTIADGAARILEAGSAARLEEVDLR